MGNELKSRVLFLLIF